MVSNKNKLLLICFILVCNACAGHGLIYTNVTDPECTDMRSTKVGSKVARGKTIRVEIPTSRVNLTAEWNTRAIGDVAKKNKFSKIYFCDKKTFSIFGGLYRQEEIIVYGD